MYLSSFNGDKSSESMSTLDTLLKHTICSFVRSQVLFTAIRLNLFTIIDQSPIGSLTQEEMPFSGISFSLLAYLVYLRLLKKCSNSNRYECTSVTRTYLVSSRRNYVGLGIGVWNHRRLYTFFLRLSETLRSGRRTSEQSDKISCLWSTFEQQHDPMIYFARIMSSFTRCTIDELCDRVDFSPYSTLLDVGGSLGDLSRTMVKRYPHMKAYSFDLPELTRWILSSNIEIHPNVQHISGNFLDNEWPDVVLEKINHIDLICLKYILHDWSIERREFLLRKIYQTLQNKVQTQGGNGTLLIIEKMIDTHRQNLTSLCTSVSMAIECGDGIGYDATRNEYKQVLLTTGFHNVHDVQLTGPMVALFAHVQ